MKKLLKKLGIGIIILAFLGTITASAGISNRDKNLIVDGNAERADVTAWTVTANRGDLTKVASSVSGSKQALRITNNYEGNSMYTHQTVLPSSTAPYRITAWVRGDGACIPSMYPGHAENMISGTASTNWQRINIIKTSTISTVFYLYSTCATLGGWVEYDELTVTRDYGAIQNRDKSLVADGDMEKTATTGWTAVTISLSKETTTPYGGIRYLRLSYNGSNASGYASQAIAAVGYVYSVKGWFRTSGGAFAKLGNSSTSTYITLGEATSWTYFNTIVPAVGGGGLSFGASTLGTDRYVEFDDVSITRDYGTTQNRDKNLLTDGDTEKTGTTNWVAVNAVAISKVTGALNTTGTRKLRTTNTTGTSGSMKNTWYSVLAGERYRITGRAECEDANIRPIIYRIGGISQSLFTGGVGLNFIDVTVTMSANGQIAFYNSETGGTNNKYCDWDNLSVTRAY